MAELSYRSPRRRRHWIVVLVAVALAGVAVTFVVRSHPLQQEQTDPGRPAPSPAETSIQPTAGDVTWRRVAGVELPFSRLHGPRMTTGGQAAGYSRSEQGAALAAVQVLMRTSASAGPEVYGPVLAAQLTGPNLPAMKLAIQDDDQRAGVSPRQSTASGNAQVAGYLIAAYDADAGTAAVDVVVTSPDMAGQYMSFRAALVWSYDDWRVLAPPLGSWGSVATVLGAPPAGLLDYAEIS